MRRIFDVGDKVKMTADALDNYGHRYEGQVFEIEEWYDHYSPPKAMAHDRHGHPGFDGASGSVLYHCKGLSFDLYDWELRPV